jgi:hypothetical protein
MASHDDDTMPEETQGYKLSQPKQSLAEYQQMGMCISFKLRDMRSTYHQAMTPHVNTAWNHA